LAHAAGIDKIISPESGNNILLFKDVVDEWPRFWVLSSVNLLGESGSIRVTSDDFLALKREIPSFELK
jgi:hypothetical protein